jgi:aspartyl/glutamyl-tRNA(Asn/Gln) amidotransferase C subunit
MLTKDDIKKIASLSRLYVSDSDLDALATDMSAIVEFANQIAECEISAAERAVITENETGSTLSLMREDTATGSPARSTSLAPSATSDGEYFALEVYKRG